MLDTDEGVATCEAFVSLKHSIILQLHRIQVSQVLSRETGWNCRNICHRTASTAHTCTDMHVWRHPFLSPPSWSNVSLAGLHYTRLWEVLSHWLPPSQEDLNYSLGMTFNNLGILVLTTAIFCCFADSLVVYVLNQSILCQMWSWNISEFLFIQ